MMQCFTFKKPFQKFAILLLNMLSDLKVTLVGSKGHKPDGENFQREKELAAMLEHLSSIPRTHLYLQKVSRCNSRKEEEERQNLH